MPDILNLLDSTVPLQTRYDAFLDWDNQNATTVISLIADKLQISEAAVEVFLDLGKLNPDEFSIIDNAHIPIDALFFIVKEDKNKRLVIYESYPSVIANTLNPQRKLKDYIDEISVPNFHIILTSISGEAYFSIAKYLKDLDIQDGTITKQFRGLLFSIGKILKGAGDVTERQTDWVIRGITHDKIQRLNVFSNDILRQDWHEDYLKFQTIRLLIDDVN